MRRSRTSGLFCLGLLVAAGCGPDDQRTESVNPEVLAEARAELGQDVAMALDSGSAAFRREDFELAREHYQRASELAPDHAAPWFGIYMTERALGNVEAAAAALERARASAPEATLLTDTVP